MNLLSMGYSLPATRPGQIIGLLGGSFDPPHSGHVHISLEAIKRFGLDRLWWLPSPGNPLKEKGPAPLDARIDAAKAIIDHPIVCISDIESKIGTIYTAQTLEALQSARPNVRFVWLMGADNLAQFDQWQNWRDIMERVGLGVLARPGQQISAQLSKTSRVYRAARIKGEASGLLGHIKPPVWCFVNLPMTSISSTMLRNYGAWQSRAIPVSR
ncbi:MAG: nicotinate-nucleotide adenylyltransferase [Roseovarius sp.]|nr:nicotinate-nucleotide adenylyltransferase [Roseovarius sp.]MCY4290460.1 nicotinate-nucleotide adenylyltransferase [Roseovarius sp.]MCY4315496.1 nicotinate-nucleotide adenylyltransferase [Roseovarius sp.]